MSIERTFDLIINAGTSSPLIINANQNDSGEIWEFNLYQEDGTKVIPAAGEIVGLKSDGHAIVNAGTVNSSGQVVITETAQMTAAPGANVFEIVFDSVHGTANFILYVEKSPVDDDADFSESDISAIQQAIAMAIDSATVQAIQNGLAQESATRAAQDAQLAGDISEEAATRAAADAVLRQAIDDAAIVPAGSTVVVDNTLSIAGAAADAKKTGDAVSDLNQALNKYLDLTNEFDSNDLEDGYIHYDGTVHSDPNVKHTDYIPCKYGDYIYVAGGSANQIPTCAFFDEDKNFLYTYTDTSGTVNTPTQFPVNGSKLVAYAIYNVRSSVYVPYASQYFIVMNNGYLIKNSDALSDAKIENINTALMWEDAFDESELIKGYVDNSGVFHDDSSGSTGFKVTDFIPCTNGSYFWFRAGGASSLSTLCFYDSEKNCIGVYMATEYSINSAGEYGVDIDDRVAYVRYNIRSATYVPYDQQYLRIQKQGFFIRQLQSQKRTVVVSKSGTAQFSKIVDAVSYAMGHPGTTIEVEPGTYDIIEELGGSEYTESLSGYSTYTGGILLGNNTKIVGAGSNVKLTANYTAATNQVMTDKFSIFNIVGSFRLENIELEVTNVRYCVHEDTLALAAASRPLYYRGEYVNCKMKHNGTTSTTYNVSACIGGGTMNNSLHIINGCVLTSPQNINPASYHNNATSNNGVPRVIVKDTYFANNGTFSVSVYDNNTQKIYAEVSGCRLGAEIVNNTSGLHEVLAWNNSILPRKSKRSSARLTQCLTIHSSFQ